MLWNTSVISNNDSRPIPTFIKHDKATTYQALSCDVMPCSLVHRYQYLGKPAASTVTLHASTMLMETAHSPEITYLPTTSSHKTIIFTAISVRTRNLTWAYQSNPIKEVISNQSH